MGSCPLTKEIRGAIFASTVTKKIFFFMTNVMKENFNMNITTKQLVLTSVLAAIYVVLSILSVGTNDFKVSIESLAVLTGGITVGPLGGFFVGLVGEFIHQITGPYGVDITTPLWVLPYAIEGLLAGLLVKKEFGNISRKKIIFTILPCEIILTILVTLVNWVSAIVQGWGSWQVIAAMIPLRLTIMLVRIVVYIFVLPLLYSRIKKAI